jgi:hypothetical protein
MQPQFHMCSFLFFYDLFYPTVFDTPLLFALSADLAGTLECEAQDKLATFDFQTV